MNEPEDQRQDDRDHQAGDDREVEEAVLGLDADVAGEVTETERKLAAEIQKGADEDEQTTEGEKHTAEFAEGIHEGIIEEKSSRPLLKDSTGHLKRSRPRLRICC